MESEPVFIAGARVIRSKRRSIALEIARDAQLVIRAPLRISAKAIEAFVVERSAWIEKHQRLARDRFEQRPSRSYSEGEQFLYLGKWHTLRIDHDAAYRLALREDEFHLSHFYVREARDLFKEWYRRRAREEIGKRAMMYAVAAGMTYKQIRISSARTRWGSCSPDNNLSFPWRLVMAPLQVIDSVVVHELAHTEYKNHGKRFWRRVYSLFPAYREADRWLDANEHLLIL